MERLVLFGALLAFVSLSHTSAQHSTHSVVVEDGRIGVAHITGGTFGAHSFSIGTPGERTKTKVHVNEDEDVQHVVLQSSTNHKEQQENYQPSGSVSDESNNSGGFNKENTQLYPVKSLTNTNSGGKKGSDAGQILIGAVAQNSDKHIKDNKKRNGNKAPAAPDAAAIGTIFGSNVGNTGLPNTEKGLSNTGKHGSIQIVEITEGNFEDGFFSINNNRKPGTNVFQKGSDVNNENAGNTNTKNDTQDSKDHNTKNNSAGNARIDSNHSQINSGYNSDSSNERWIWNR